MRDPFTDTSHARAPLGFDRQPPQPRPHLHVCRAHARGLDQLLHGNIVAALARVDSGCIAEAEKVEAMEQWLARGFGLQGTTHTGQGSEEKESVV